MVEQALFYRNLYPILDLDTCHKYGIEPVDLAKRLIQNGSNLFQLRAKSLNRQQYRELARTIQKITSARIIANDHFELLNQQIDTGDRLFTGIHIGQEDFKNLISQKSVSSIINRFQLFRSNDLITGISTHTVEQVQAAIDLSAFDYIATGPWFATTSKPTGKDPVLNSDQKEEMLKLICESTSSAVLIGGITDKTIHEIRRYVPEGCKDRVIVCAIAAIATENGLKKMYDSVSELLD